jgi:hypothetical protein
MQRERAPGDAVERAYRVESDAASVVEKPWVAVVAIGSHGKHGYLYAVARVSPSGADSKTAGTGSAMDLRAVFGPE